MYDAAIIGAGPAGLSAALNLKLHQKNILWFGTRDMSMKVGKSEKIANYPGVPMVSGEELNRRFLAQAEEMGLTLTDRMVTNISSAGKGFMILGDNEIYEAKAVILATGAVSAKGFPGEEELLGRGVSYCATCDGFLYSGKTVAVFCGEKRFEHEVEYLAGLAEKVYLYAAYSDCELDFSNVERPAQPIVKNVERLTQPIVKIEGRERAERITLKDGSVLKVDGVFVLRSSVAPDTLLKGLAMDGAHIAADRNCATNKSGVFAAGDCTGRPYQIAKAVGEGNIAAHSVLEYLSELEK